MLYNIENAWGSSNIAPIILSRDFSDKILTEVEGLFYGRLSQIEVFLSQKTEYPDSCIITTIKYSLHQG